MFSIFTITKKCCSKHVNCIFLKIQHGRKPLQSKKSQSGKNTLTVCELVILCLQNQCQVKGCLCPFKFESMLLNLLSKQIVPVYFHQQYLRESTSPRTQLVLETITFCNFDQSNSRQMIAYSCFSLHFFGNQQKWASSQI